MRLDQLIDLTILMTIMKLPYQLSKLMKTSAIKIAYHEVGHAIVAKMFHDRLLLSNLTLNQEYLKTVDPTYTGGLQIIIKNPPTKIDIELEYAMIFIGLAGICSRTLFVNGREKVQRDLQYLLLNPSAMETDGASDDLQIIRLHTQRLALIPNINPTVIKQKIFKYLYKFLSEETVWNGVITLVKELYNSPNQSLSDDQINNILKNAGAIDFIRNYRKIIP